MIHLYILCYNESILLPHTIAHYKYHLPSCKITILDNESSDNSVELAKSLGCNVKIWSSNGKNDVDMKKDMLNDSWKGDKGWIFCLDMDEWLVVNEEQLNYEKERGVTILRVHGCNMIGESQKEDLSDIDLHAISKYVLFKGESKNVCFYALSITNINYNGGQHKINPKGVVVYSEHVYNLKHMSILGIPFYINKNLNRYARSEHYRLKKSKTSNHYSKDVQQIIKRYNYFLNNALTYG